MKVTVSTSVRPRCELNNIYLAYIRYFLWRESDSAVSFEFFHLFSYKLFSSFWETLAASYYVHADTISLGTSLTTLLIRVYLPKVKNIVCELNRIFYVRHKEISMSKMSRLRMLINYKSLDIKHCIMQRTLIQENYIFLLKISVDWFICLPTTLVAKPNNTNDF